MQDCSRGQNQSRATSCKADVPGMCLLLGHMGLGASDLVPSTAPLQVACGTVWGQSLSSGSIFTLEELPKFAPAQACVLPISVALLTLFPPPPPDIPFSFLWSYYFPSCFKACIWLPFVVLLQLTPPGHSVTALVPSEWDACVQVHFLHTP